MKRVFLLTVVCLCFFTLMVYADNTNEERDARLRIDSYHYGLSGKDCSDIYYDGGTSNWTFQSNDPGVLDKLHEKCKVGEKDFLKGQKELPQILDKIKNKQ